MGEKYKMPCKVCDIQGAEVCAAVKETNMKLEIDIVTFSATDKNFLVGGSPVMRLERGS